jgi:hypothetical protein
MMNKDAVNTHGQVFVWTKVSAPLGKYQRAAVLDGMIRLYVQCKQQQTFLQSCIFWHFYQQ